MTVSQPLPCAPRRLPLRLLPLLAAMGLSSCRMVPSHLHSKANEEAMKKAKDAMDAQNAAAPGIYTAMQSNLDLFAREENRVLTAFADVAGQTTVTYKDMAITEKVLKNLIDDGETATKGEINTFIDVTLPRKIHDIDGLTKQQKDAIASAKDPIAKLTDEISSKKDDVNMYNSSIALLRTAIIDAPGLSTSLAGSIKLDDARTAFSTLANEIGKTITYVDADGKTQSEDASKIAESAFKWFKGNAKSPRGPLFPQAPGIDLIVLNASLKLLEVQRDAAAAELDYLDKTRVVLAEAYTRALLARELARDSLLSFSRIPVKRPNTFPTQMEMQARLARKVLDKNKGTADGELDAPIDPDIAVLRNSLLCVRKLAVAKSSFARSQALLDLGLQRVEHQRSIALSNVNDAGRRAVISRAIEGLHVYHSSGFRPEHLAQIAQVVALGAIALK